MLNNLGLGIVLEAKDEFSEVMQHARHEFHETEKSTDEVANKAVKSLGKWTFALASIGVAATAAAGAIGYKLASEAAEGSMVLAQAGAKAGATAEQMEELRKAADDVGLKGLGTTSDEAAQHLKSLITEGLGVEGSLAALDATIRLTKVSMGEMAGPQAAQALASILKEFHFRASDASSVVDKMTVAMRLFGVSANDVVPMVTGVARGTQLAGATFEDALAAVGMAKKVLPDVGQAIMGVNMAMAGLAGGAARAKLAAFGVHAADTTGHLRPLLAILADLNVKMAGMSEAKQAEKLGSIFGARGAGTMVAIMNELSHGVRSASGEMVYGSRAAAELTNQMTNSRGAAQEMTARLEDEFITQQKRVRASAAQMVDFLGDPFKEILTPVLAGVNFMLKSINKELADGTGIWGSFVQGANAVGLAFQGVIQLFEQGGFSGKVLEELNKADNAGIKTFAVQFWHWIGVIQNAMDGFSNGWERAMEFFEPTFERLSLAWKGLRQALGLTAATAEENASTWDTMGDIGAYLGTLLVWIGGVLAEVVAGALRIVNTATKTLIDLWTVIGPVIKPVLYLIADGIRLVVGLLNGDMKGALQSFAGIAIDSIGFVIGMVSTLLRTMVSVVDWVGSLFGADLGMAASVGRQLDEVEASIKKFRDEVTGNVVEVAAPAFTQPAPIASSSDVGQTSSTAGASVIPAAAMAAMVQSSAPRAAANQSLVSANESVGPAEAVSHIHVHVDGEQVAEAVHRADLRKKARAFQPIAAGAGG